MVEDYRLRVYRASEAFEALGVAALVLAFTLTEGVVLMLAALAPGTIAPGNWAAFIACSATATLCAVHIFLVNRRTFLEVLRDDHGGSWRSLNGTRRRHLPILETRKRPDPLDLEVASFSRWVADGWRGAGWKAPGNNDTRPIPAVDGSGRMPTDTEIGTMLRTARERIRKTQEHVALEAGVSARTLRRAENGGRISAESIRAVCAALDLRIVEVPAEGPGKTPGWVRMARRLGTIYSGNREGGMPWASNLQVVSLIIGMSSVILLFVLLFHGSGTVPRACTGPSPALCRIAAASEAADWHDMQTSSIYLAFGFAGVSVAGTVAAQFLGLRGAAANLLHIFRYLLITGIGFQVVTDTVEKMDKREAMVAEIVRSAAVADAALTARFRRDLPTAAAMRKLTVEPILEGFASGLEDERNRRPEVPAK